MRVRRWRLVIPLAAVLVVVVGTGVGLLVLRDEDSRSPKPRADLPPVAADDARATLSYLGGEGAALMRMHQEAADEPLRDGRERCEKAVRRLDDAAASERVAGLMRGVQDQPLRAAFDAERLALGVGLTRCAKRRRATPGDAARLARAVDLSSQRLDELEAAVR